MSGLATMLCKKILLSLEVSCISLDIIDSLRKRFVEYLSSTLELE